MKRPTVATVFGVLSVIFGGLSLIFSVIGIAVTIAMFSTGNPISGILGILGIVVTILLLLSGLMLLLNKKSALQFNLYYVIASVVVTLVNIIYGFVAGLGFIGAFGLIGLIYPILIFIFVLRNDAVKKFYA